MSKCPKCDSEMDIWPDVCPKCGFDRWADARRIRADREREAEVFNGPTAPNMGRNPGAADV